MKVVESNPTYLPSTSDVDSGVVTSDGDGPANPDWKYTTRRMKRRSGSKGKRKRRRRAGRKRKIEVADIPDLREKNADDSTPLKETCLWTPDSALNDDAVTDYIVQANRKSKFGEEEALALLYYHNHNISTALEDLQFFKHPKLLCRWSKTDVVTFEHIYKQLLCSGKNEIAFHKFKPLLGGKSTQEIVYFYYTYKIQKKRIQLMRFSKWKPLKFERILLQNERIRRRRNGKEKQSSPQ